MAILDRFRLRVENQTGTTPSDALLEDYLESAKFAIQIKQYPFGGAPSTLDPMYQDLQLQIAIVLYNQNGMEGETSHTDNGISIHTANGWVPASMLSAVVPNCKVVG